MTKAATSDLAGRLYAGTSGFAYPGWAPRFYPPGVSGSQLLRAYAERLPAVELNSTFHRRPSPGVVAAWLAATADDFRFCPKAQRGSAVRAFTAADPRETLDWLTPSLAAFGRRLGCVLLSLPTTLRRDDGALGRVLATWPVELPLALELRHPSWADDEVFARLREHRVVLVASDMDDAPEPDLRLTGASLYVRLRRTEYAPADQRRWAARLRPFLEAGHDAWVFFRHDEDGMSALRAEALARLVVAPPAAPEGWADPG